MSLQNFDTLDTPENLEKKPRRVFLISLVCLTFLASALKLFISILYFADFRAPKVVLEESWLRWQILCMILFGLNAIPATISVVMMLLGKKRAFILYLFAQAIMTASVCCFYLSVSQVDADNDFFAMFASLIMLFLTVAFTVLYYFALKPQRINVQL